MALIKCAECGKDVSDSAKTCPHCGVKVRATPAADLAKENGLLFLKLMGYAAVFCFIVAVVFVAYIMLR